LFIYDLAALLSPYRPFEFSTYLLISSHRIRLLPLTPEAPTPAYTRLYVGRYISTNALVTGKIRIAPNRFVPSGAIIETQEQTDALGPVPESQEERKSSPDSTSWRAYLLVKIPVSLLNL
jgi:hypothetical protein